MLHQRECKYGSVKDGKEYLINACTAPSKSKQDGEATMLFAMISILKEDEGQRTQAFTKRKGSKDLQ